jgi:transcription initiation factor TFIIIB Brf1 subunit/transcription initiation factor TFIIB
MAGVPLSVKKTRKKLAEVTGVLEKSVRRKVKK